jgi:thioredoxin 2
LVPGGWQGRRSGFRFLRGPSSGWAVQRTGQLMAAGPANIVACDNCGTKNRVPAATSGVPKCGKCGAWLPWVAEAGDDDFDQVAGASSIPVLVDLWAEWCGPCRMVSPVLEHLAHSRAGQLKLVKVDVDKAPQIARRFEARSIPTLLLMDHGNVVSRQVGAAPAHVLENWVDGALAKGGGSGPAASA